MTKYQNKYRVETCRLCNRDYGANGYYYVTIKTKKAKCYFGKINDHIMVYSPLGEVARKCWLDIPEHYPFVVLDEFVIMPNHVHGILLIDKQKNNGFAETQDLASLRNQNTIENHKNKFGPQSQNLGAIIRGYKIGVTKYARKNNIPFQWHPRFHDRVLRQTMDELEIKRNYIKNNPLKWGD